MRSAVAPQTAEIALVMTDIEGSTALWERAPEAAAEALLVHNALVRALLERHAGYEIKSEGDAFALAFSDVRAALSWALELDEALARHPWPGALYEDERPPVRVRAGLHTGQPIRHTDPVTGRVDFLGPVMNRAARVSAAGHGGQILLSEAAWERLREDLLELGLEAQDLGLYVLRGLSAPERVRQVRRLGRPQRRFPPLRAVRWRPQSPLAGRDLFVGRVEDLARIHSRLMFTRLLTLRGPGGTGKTRLACRYGAESEADWPGGVIFCDLSDARTGTAALSGVVRALGLGAGAGDAEVASALAGRGRTLLILDNLEQVVEEAAPHVARWLSAEGGSAILTTSRRALGLPGEDVLELAPLSLPPEDARRPEELLSAEAAQLYVERASEHGAPLTLGPQTCADIAALVRRLDGLPLAIELAAAWSRLHGPATILARVQERIDELGRPGSGRVARQSALDAVVQWSWELLSPREQATFAQLSVFEGGIDARLAERVVSLDARPGGPPLPQILERLVEHSLLRRDEARARLSMLVTLQSFAASRLTDEARRAAEGRHADALLSLVERVRTRQRSLGNAPELLVERGNLVAALQRALQAQDGPRVGALAPVLTQVLNRTGPLREAQELARQSLGCPGLTEAQRARLTLDLGELLRNLGQLGEARALLAEAVARAEGLGDLPLRVEALLGLGVLEHDLRRYEEARARYQEALALAEQGVTPTAHVRVLYCLGHLARETGALDEAERLLRRALALCPADDRWLHLRALLAWASFQADRGDTADAARTLRELVNLSTVEGDRHMEIVARGNLARVLIDQSRDEEALGAIQRALPVCRALGNRRLTAINVGLHGRVLLNLGRLDEAERSIREALALCEELGLRDNHGSLRGALGAILIARGELAQGWAELEAGVVEVEAVGNLLLLLGLRLAQARHAETCGHPPEPYTEDARVLCRRLGLSPRSPQARELAELRGAVEKRAAPTRP